MPQTHVLPSAQVGGCAGEPPTRLCAPTPNLGCPCRACMTAGVDAPSVATSAPWGVRRNSALAALSTGDLLLVGGFRATALTCLNDVWSSVDGGTSWHLESAASTFGRRMHHALVVLSDDTLVLLGGTRSVSSSWVPLSDVWTWTPGNASFIQRNPGAWVGRWALGAVVMPDDSIVVCGGYNGTADFNDCHRSPDSGVTWVATTAAATWDARRRHGMAAIGTKIVVAGGYAASSSFTDVYSSTDMGVTWTPVTSDAGWAAGSAIQLTALPNGHLLANAGATAWLSVDAGGQWHAFAAPPWSGHTERVEAVLQPTTGHLVAAGGDGPGVWRIQRDAEWVSGPCSDERPALCSAPPFSTFVSVDIPELSGSIKPANAAAVAPATFLYAPPVAAVTVADGHGRTTTSQAVLHVQFTAPVAGLSSQDFVITPVDAPVVTVSSAVLTGAQAEWALSVDVLIEAPLCPVHFSGSLVVPHCVRVVTALGTWEQQQQACAPYSLSKVVSPAHTDLVRATTGTVAFPHWCVGAAVCEAACTWHSVHSPLMLCVYRRIGLQGVGSAVDAFSWADGTTAATSAFRGWASGQPAGSGDDCGAIVSGERARK